LRFIWLQIVQFSMHYALKYGHACRHPCTNSFDRLGMIALQWLAHQISKLELSRDSLREKEPSVRRAMLCGSILSSACC